ncbi:Uncharacterised protein [Corynebacterium renale]|nr:hypothetical protein [Corynebacterium renale]SQG63733.1 Uncharacterised protein [Corynebacterium renale]STD01853.1 Uncharacterised protein [Corynebacterium renale]
MILTLTGTWSLDPDGPLRESADVDGEDLWGLINAMASIMSGVVYS